MFKSKSSHDTRFDLLQGVVILFHLTVEFFLCFSGRKLPELGMGVFPPSGSVENSLRLNLLTNAVD